MAITTVCVPTYNGVDFLGACLESILLQTCQEIEILVVDDGSTDGTIDIVRRYARTDPRIRLVCNHSNIGLVANWNRCVELSRGEWIKFVFQDDLIAPTCVEDLLAARVFGTDLIICRRNFIYENGTSAETRAFYDLHLNPDRVFCPDNNYVEPEAVCAAALDNIGVNIFGEPSSVLIRREAFANYGFFNPDLAMICDTEYWVRLSIHNGFVYLPKTLSTFRVHSGSTSAHYFANKQYRITLDGVVLLSEYAHNPLYEPLREVARQRDPPIDLDSLLDKKIAGARWTAIDSARRATNPDANLLLEWEALLARHPGLRQQARSPRGLLDRISSLWRKR